VRLRFVSVVALLCPAMAFADPSPADLQTARDLFHKAEKDEDAANWAVALDEVKHAAAVKMTPGLRYHIALCEEKLGQLAAALDDYSAAETLAKAEKNREVLDAVAEPLRALKARVPTLAIDVPPDVQGVEVTLDGKVLTVPGTATPLDAGSHQIGAHAPGKSPFSATVVLKEKDAQRVSVKLEDAPTQATPTSAPTQTVTPTPIEAPAPEQGPSRVPAIITTVGAVALIGFGVGAFFVADGQQSDAKAFCATVASPTCDANQTQIRAWDAVALTSWITGGALAVVAVVLWALPSHAKVSARGLSLSGSF
jgi:hypothetical protein